MTLLTRREALSALAFGSAGLATGCAHGAPRGAQAAEPNRPPASRGTTMTAPTALAGDHQLVPLPFAPGSLHGLSERLITSHHENNYGGAVRNLNRAEVELAKITADTAPFVVAALRERELTFRNSKALHEAYFGNLGGDGECSGAIERALAEAYGSSARWEEHFRATGSGLGGGSGWVVLALELDTGTLRSVGMANHTQALSTAAPLLVMDMYEHSYQMDFGAAVARYLDGFFTNIQWDEVNRRFGRAQRASAVLRGAGG